MEFEFLNFLCSMGVGAVFGGVMFFVYRTDQKKNQEQVREDRKFMEDRLTKIIEKDQESRELNTTATTKLSETIDRLSDRLPVR